MPLNLEDVRELGVIDELARVFEDERPSRTLLNRVKFPRANIPNGHGNPQEFWDTVVDEIDHGLIQDGFDALVAAAHETYPYNRVFSTAAEAAARATAPRAAPSAAPKPKGRVGANIAARNCNDVDLVIDTARRIAAANNLPGPIEPAYHSAGTLMLDLPEMSADQAVVLSRLLANDLQGRGYETRFSSSAAAFRDYLISPIYVEGPDQARFELTNVPASTRVSEVAHGIMGQYPSQILEKDGSGKPRPTVVDQITDEGRTRRLDPDTTLHDNGITDHSRLHVSPESTAGVYPTEREQALHRVFNEVVTYARRHPGFEVQANDTRVPTEYLFRFHAPGWGPPQSPDGPPQPVDEHVIFVVMPAEFPMAAPEAFCHSPIFHPNVDRKQGTGYVCLGALQDRYRSGEDFGKVCQTLVDMVMYQNYNLEETLDGEARVWALSVEGMAAIEARGGRSALRRELSDIVLDFRPLEVRRT